MAILLICEDLDELTTLSQALERARLKTMTARSVKQALSLHAEPEVSLILLVQYASPIDDVRRLCAAMDAPLLLITDAVREEEEITLHHGGADSIRFRPYSIQLLISQTLALLRHTHRASTAAATVLKHAGVELDSNTRMVHVPDQPPCYLTPLEYNLLDALMRHAGQTLSADDLVTSVWGYEEGDSKMLRKLVSRLRKKVEPDLGSPRYILTVPGVGYRFDQREGLKNLEN
jgi:two-component system KDP operon response regulator KdpE